MKEDLDFDKMDRDRERAWFWFKVILWVAMLNSVLVMVLSLIQ